MIHSYATDRYVTLLLHFYPSQSAPLQYKINKFHFVLEKENARIKELLEKANNH